MDVQKKRFGIVVSESVFTEFKKHVSKENTTIPKIIAQFMMNYTDYLDSSFLDGAESSRRKGIGKAHVAMTLPADVCLAFREKTKNDCLSISAVIERFMNNYISFMTAENTGVSLKRPNRNANIPNRNHG